MDACSSSNMQQEARQVAVTTRLQAMLQEKRSQQKCRIKILRSSTCKSPSCGTFVTVEKAQKKTPKERRTPKQMPSRIRRQVKKPKSKAVGNPTGGILHVYSDVDEQYGIPQEVQHRSSMPNLVCRVFASILWFLLICFIFSVLLVYSHHVFFL